MIGLSLAAGVIVGSVFVGVALYDAKRIDKVHGLIGLAILVLIASYGAGSIQEFRAYKTKHPEPIQIGKVMLAPDGTTFTQTLKEND